jgi:hypothetical protein
MKKLTLAVCALIGMSSAVQTTTKGYLGGNYGCSLGGGLDDAIRDECHPHRIRYDNTCKDRYLEDALENDIPIYGPNVVLVNLDNRRQVKRLEREGIFLQTGDLLFVTGREYTCA